MIQNYDKINHLELRGLIEQFELDSCKFTASGKISNHPETWAIDNFYPFKKEYPNEVPPDGESFLYDSELEYNQDVEILSASKVKEFYFTKQVRETVIQKDGVHISATSRDEAIKKLLGDEDKDWTNERTLEVVGSNDVCIQIEEEDGTLNTIWQEED